jgi:cell division cycle protein 37
LVNEHTASFLCIYCIDLCVEEKMDFMKQVSHQAVILQFILELAKTHKYVFCADIN